MAEPDDYNAAYKRWSFNTLPIVPADWRLLPRESAKTQINAIKLLLGKCDIVVHAGDPDREGQLLVDELPTVCPTDVRLPLLQMLKQKLLPILQEKLLKLSGK